MARLAGFAGAELPFDPLPPAPDNPTGFWESRCVSELNEEILAAEGGAWDDPFACHALARSPERAASRLEEARAALREAFAPGRPLVLKDPRLSLLAPLWSEAMAREGYCPAAVVMVREPEAVAASLAARNGLPVSQGWLLWAAYLLAAEEGVRSLPHAFVAYDELVAAPATAVGRLKSVPGLDFRSKEVASAVAGFIRPELRRHSRSTQMRPSCYSKVIAAARTFLAAAGGAELDAVSILACRAWLDELCALMAPIMHRYQQRVRFLGGEVAQHKAFEQHLSSGVAELKAEIDRLSGLVEAKYAEIVRLLALSAADGSHAPG